MAVNGSKCLELVDAVSNDNLKGEFYLTDIVEIGAAKEMQIVAYAASEEEILGINTRVELAEAEAIWQQRKRRELMLGGVSMIAPHDGFS